MFHKSTMGIFSAGYPEGAWMCIAVRVDQRIPVLSEGGKKIFFTRVQPV